MPFEKPKSPQGAEIKEWEAGFRGVQRKSVPMAKDYGYGGVEESDALANLSKPVLPFLGEKHMNQAGTRAQTAKKKRSVEQVRQRFEESKKAIGDMNREMIRKYKNMPGKNTIPGQEKSLASEEQTMKSASMINDMIKAESGSKKRNKTSRDREEDRKTALSKLKRMSERMGKGCKSVRLIPDPAAKSGEIKKDFEHLTAEYKKPAYQPKPMSPAHKQEVGFGPSATQEGPEAKKQALASSPGVTSPKPKTMTSPFAHDEHIGGPAPTVPGTPSLVGGAKQKPMAAVAGGKPTAGSHGDSDVMTSVPKNFKSLTKSAIVDLMISKAHACERSPGNSANENGPVSGSAHGGKGPAQTSAGNSADEQYPGNPANEQKSAGAEHAGKGPSQGPVSGTPHGGKGPAQTSVPADGQDQFPGNPSQMNKAVGARAVPRMPRAMAMSMDTWRSATNVMTRANSAMDKNFTHHGAGPLFPETAQSIEDESQERATRKPEMIKSCEACGRTYHIVKSMDEPCPTCSKNAGSCMSKGRGGILIPSFIAD